MEGHYKIWKGNITDRHKKKEGVIKNSCVMACSSLTLRHNEAGMALTVRSAELWLVC